MQTRVLEVRGGILEGRSVTAAEIETLAALPPVDQLRGQVLGAIAAPLYSVVGLFNAPLQNLVGLIDARIEQLGGEAEESPKPTIRRKPLRARRGSDSFRGAKEEES